MAEPLRQIRLGAATITVVNAGDSLVTLAPEMSVPESAWRPHHADVFAEPHLFPSQSIHVALPDVFSLLVDADNYALSTPPGAPFRPPDYTPPPAPLDQLAAAGISANGVTHVAITHAHYDHYCGLTVEHDGAFAPAFPHAHHYLGRPDWDAEDMQTALRGRASGEARSLGVLHARGLLELMDGDRELAPGVRVIAAPGESPGHSVVRVESQGAVLYCLGDLIHHPVEVEHLDWMPTWADPEPALASRGAVFASALAENALLIAAHIADLGRLERTSSGFQWTTAIWP